MSDQPQDRQPTEDELRAAYEEQLRQVHVDDVLVQTVLSLVNLGAMRAGLAGGAGDADPAQLRAAIEGIRALLPIVEPALGPDAGQIRQALSQLQLSYARLTGGGAEQAPAEDPADPAAPSEEAADAPDDAESGPGPAQRSGRLWVPGS